MRAPESEHEKRKRTRTFQVIVVLMLIWVGLNGLTPEHVGQGPISQLTVRFAHQWQDIVARTIGAAR